MAKKKANVNLVLARPYIPKAETSIKNATEAVADFAHQLQGPALGGVLFFCAPEYDLLTLGEAMQAAFDCPVMGCTTAGEIGRRYKRESLIGVGLPASLFQVQTFPGILMKDFKEDTTVSPIPESGKHTKSLGLLFYDDSSRHKIPAFSNNPFNLLSVPGVGSESGCIYADGQFVKDTAKLVVLNTQLPFQHFMFAQPEANIQETFTQTLKQQINALRTAVPDTLFSIGFESQVRRQFIEESGITRKVEQLLTPLNFTGFNAQEGDALQGVAFGVG